MAVDESETDTDAAVIAEPAHRIAALEAQLAALQMEVGMYRQALDAVSDMVLCKGPQSRILYANRAFRMFYGMTQQALQGLIDAPFAEPDATQQYIKDDTYVFTTGQTLTIPDEPVTRYDGDVHHFRTIKTAYHDVTGQIVATIGVSWDMTERNHAEAVMRQALRHEERVRIQEAVLEELVTPFIPISATVAIMPLIGTIDDRRAEKVMHAVLTGVAATHIKVVIVDMTGVPVLDTQVAAAVVRAARAVKLLGTQLMLTGIRPEVAQTVVGLGVDLHSISIRGTLRDGIADVLRA